MTCLPQVHLFFKTLYYPHTYLRTDVAMLSRVFNME